MPPMAKRHILRRRCRVLVSRFVRVLVTLLHLDEPPRIEDARVRVVFFVPVRRCHRRDKDSARANLCAVGELEVFECFPHDGHYTDGGRAIGDDQGEIRSKTREIDAPPLIPFSLWDSLMKLSSLCIWPTAAFVHPSEAITAFTSSRKAFASSGEAAT